MAFCTKCGAQNADNAQFCESCGGKLESQQPINAQQTVVNEQPIVNQQQNQTQGQQNTAGKGLGIASLVCGIVSFFCFGLILGILAVVFGGIAKGKGYKGGIFKIIALCKYLDYTAQLVLGKIAFQLKHAVLFVFFADVCVIFKCGSSKIDSVTRADAIIEYHALQIGKS